MIDQKELYRRADQAKEHAFVPFSGLKVGAALLCHDGTVFTGVNVENSSFGATICAERTAFVKAISEGHRSFDAIAVACNQGKASPCGVCRQFMYEFAPELTIIFGEDQDHLHIRNLAELLPEGFRLEKEKGKP